MAKKTSISKSGSGYKQRASGGTTGRPRVPKKDRNQPIVSLRVEPGLTPAHGVSGYPTTGVAGGYNMAYSADSVPLGNVNVAASRYDVQYSSSAARISRGTDFNYATPAPTVRVGAPTISNFTSEPVVAQNLFSSEGPSTASYLARNQQLQAGGGHQRSSLLEEQAFTGYLGSDLYMQSQVPSLDQNRTSETMHGEVMSPAPAVRLQFTPRPSTNPRQDNQNSGTVNQENAIPTVGPMGRGDLHSINDAHTPARITAGYSSTGTHHAHGPVPQSQFDGSWTLDVLPGQRKLMLTDLPPPADIPVQTYSGYSPQNTSVEYMRPAGGSLITPSIQRVAVFT